MNSEIANRFNHPGRFLKIGSQKLRALLNADQFFINPSFLLVFIHLFLRFSVIQAQPEPPNLIKITVEPWTDNVQLYWEASPTDSVEFYSIWIPTDDVGVGRGIKENIRGLEFTIQNSRAEDHPVGYTVRALIPPSEYSIWKEEWIDSTIHLKANEDYCNAKIDIEWTNYIGWEEAIREYILFVFHIRNNNPQLVDSISLGPEQRNYEYRDIEAGINYGFVIEAVKESATRVFSTSNSATVEATVPNYPDYMHAIYGTVSGNNHPELMFDVDTASELNQYTLWRSESPDEFNTQIHTFDLSEAPFTYVDEEVDASERPYYYQLRTENNLCDSGFIQTSENIASTVYLDAVASDYMVQLDWTPYRSWMGTDSSFLLERSMNGTFENIATPGATSLTFTDDLSAFANDAVNNNNLISNEICYRIIAREHSESATHLNQQSTSNIACVVLDPVVRFEYDAFTPGEAQNNQFGPVLDYAPAEFNFKIFNRWGNLVFETDDPSQRWNGEESGDGRPMPEGVYRYQLRYLNDSGNTVVLHGKVTLVR